MLKGWSGQSSVKVDPEIFDMAFEGTIMIADSQVVILWHSDTSTKSYQKSFSFVIVQLQLVTVIHLPTESTQITKKERKKLTLCVMHIFCLFFFPLITVLPTSVCSVHNRLRFARFWVGFQNPTYAPQPTHLVASYNLLFWASCISSLVWRSDNYSVIL